MGPLLTKVTISFANLRLLVSKAGANSPRRKKLGMTQRLKFYALGVVGELAQSQGNCSLAARKNASTTASAYPRYKIDFDIARATQTEITSLGQRPKKKE